MLEALNCAAAVQRDFAVQNAGLPADQIVLVSHGHQPWRRDRTIPICANLPGDHIAVQIQVTPVVRFVETGNYLSHCCGAIFDR